MQWPWTWANTGNCWGTERPGVLQFTGSQRFGHDKDWKKKTNEFSRVKAYLFRPMYSIKFSETEKSLWFYNIIVPFPNNWKQKLAVSAEQGRNRGGSPKTNSFGSYWEHPPKYPSWNQLAMSSWLIMTILVWGRTWWLSFRKLRGARHCEGTAPRWLPDLSLTSSPADCHSKSNTWEARVVESKVCFIQEAGSLKRS